MKLTFLTPQLPPNVCGLGDHTVHLAAALRERVNGITALYAKEPAEIAGLPFDRADHWNCEANTLNELLTKHEADLLWVQYSGYGYAWQGLPRYLVRALQQLRGRVPIAVYFHETHCRISQLGAKGVVVAPWQRHIGKQIAHCADIVLTSCQLYRNSIQREYGVPDAKLHLLPIGSNIPVPTVSPQVREQIRTSLGWSSDAVIAVTFGSTGSQRQALRRNQPALIEAIQSKLIDRIMCVGGAPGQLPLDLINSCDETVRASISVIGHQSDSRIGEILVAADVALSRYPQERLGKSGAIMAYALAGLPALVESIVDERVCNGDASCLIDQTSVRDLASVQFDAAARRAKQERAESMIGWPALATRALQLIAPLVDKC